MNQDIVSYSTAGIFLSTKNTKIKYPMISSDFNEKTIYLAFIYFCKFKSLIPIPPDLLPLCTDKPINNLINPNDSIERIIQILKEDGRNYNYEQFLRLLQVIGQHNIVNINLENPEISSITILLKLLENMENEEEEIIGKPLRDLIFKSLDSFGIANENNTKEIKDLNNFLIKNSEIMKEEIIDYIKKNTGPNVTNKAVKKMVKTIENLNSWNADESNRNENIKISNENLYNIINFFKEFIDNFVNIFPNIILNKVNYDDVFIPSYYGFSSNHNKKLKKNISEYYENLKVFYGIPTLDNLLLTIQKTCKNIVILSKITPSFSSIRVDKDKYIKPVFDERTSRFLFEYYLLRIIINFIELSEDDSMIVKEMKVDNNVTDIFSVDYIDEINTRVDISFTERQNKNTILLTGNKKELKQSTNALLIAFFDILNKQKELINISYEEIQDRNFKLREKEKNMVTDRLKKLTDEQRDADTILKINKLGMYSKGMQKGLTNLDKDFYDEEQEFRENMVKAEKKIRRSNPDANDENIDILIGDYLEQEEINNQIEEEVYDMDYMNEDFYNGNTDGVEAPEAEYEDYEEDL